MEMIGNYSIGDFKIIRRCPPFRSHCYEMAKIPKVNPRELAEVLVWFSADGQLRGIPRIPGYSVNDEVPMNTHKRYEYFVFRTHE